VVDKIDKVVKDLELNMKDKVAVVTGGSMGIGKAIALEFAREGAKVATFARDSKRILALNETFKEEGNELYYESFDMTNLDNLEAFVERTIERFSRIDFWINNAGVNIRKPYMEYTEQDWEQIVNLNLKSLFFGTRIAAKQMAKTGGGVIVNASSFTGKMPFAGESIYSMTKAGVNSLTRTFATELAPLGIRVVGFMPGVTETEMAVDILAKNREKMTKDIVLRRVGQPLDMAKPVVFLCSEAAKHITGVSLEIDGGKFAVQNPSYGWDLAQIK
jgi:NAD(P)-dependent dehydrogenase (short-subunit alcohol dehydrogenase family)